MDPQQFMKQLDEFQASIRDKDFRIQSEVARKAALEEELNTSQQQLQLSKARETEFEEKVSSFDAEKALLNKTIFQLKEEVRNRKRELQNLSEDLKNHVSKAEADAAEYTTKLGAANQAIKTLFAKLQRGETASASDSFTADAMDTAAGVSQMEVDSTVTTATQLRDALQEVSTLKAKLEQAEIAKASEPTTDNVIEVKDQELKRLRQMLAEAADEAEKKNAEGAELLTYVNETEENCKKLQAFIEHKQMLDEFLEFSVDMQA
eukprot:TRINITY_DN121_c0_g2_i1.p1 TRINITY_DN121_c0_g2~~TRINITY_DN121_c0_g2_i1.p1  ORF type:complete len:263 (+),score=95.83 TRINITY_DN121_c0_g2_i1:280-1068(+)